MYLLRAPFQMVRGTAEKLMMTEMMRMAPTALASCRTWAWLIEVALGSSTCCSSGDIDALVDIQEGSISARTIVEMLNELVKPV